MTAVKVGISGICVEGHSGYAECGKDIVCAAVSTLTQNLIKSIECLTEDEIAYTICPGQIKIDYKNLSEKAKTLVDSFFIGVSDIAAEYPDYVTIG